MYEGPESQSTKQEKCQKPNKGERLQIMIKNKKKVKGYVIWGKLAQITR